MAVRRCDKCHAYGELQPKECILCHLPYCETCAALPEEENSCKGGKRHEYEAERGDLLNGSLAWEDVDEGSAMGFLDAPALAMMRPVIKKGYVPLHPPLFLCHECRRARSKKILKCQTILSILIAIPLAAYNLFLI